MFIKKFESFNEVLYKEISLKDFLEFSDREDDTIYPQEKNKIVELFKNSFELTDDEIRIRERDSNGFAISYNFTDDSDLDKKQFFQSRLSSSIQEYMNNNSIELFKKYDGWWLLQVHYKLILKSKFYLCDQIDGVHQAFDRLSYIRR